MLVLRTKRSKEFVRKKIALKFLRLLQVSKDVIKYGQLRLILPPEKNSNKSKKHEGDRD